MLPKRSGRDGQSMDSSDGLTIASETLRNSSSRKADDEKKKEGEEKISLFWRVFGGTILSIAALVLITIYQSLASSLHELRTDIAHLNEAKAEFIKKEEFASHKTSVWNRMEAVNALNASLTAVKEKLGGLDEQRKAIEAAAREHQALAAAVAAVQSKLTAIDQQAKQIEQNQKDLQAASVAIGALQEKSRLRDDEIKQINDGRSREVLATQAAFDALKSKLATVEGLPKQCEQFQKDIQAAQSSLAGILEKCATRDAELKGVREEVKADADRIKALIDSHKEGQSLADQQLKRWEQDHKDLQQTMAGLAAIQDKSVNRDAELKGVHEERRRLDREVQALRERLAKLEGATENKGSPAPAVVKPSPRPTPKGEEEATPE